MIRILFGNEPYAIDARKNRLLQGIGDISIFDGEFDTEILAVCRAFSLLSDQKGVVLKADTLKALDNRAFEAYLKEENPGTVLLVIVKTVDARTKLYKHLQKEGLLLACNKVETEDAFRKVILYELKKRGAQITESGMREFEKRMNYFVSDEMNLLRAAGFLEQMTFVTNEITEEVVRAHTPSFEEANAFGIASLMEAGDASALLREINMLPSSDAIRIMSLILRELRIAYKLHFLKAQEIGIRADNAVFRNHPRNVLAEGLKIVTDYIEAIKKGFYADMDALKMSVAEVMHLLKRKERNT